MITMQTDFFTVSLYNGENKEKDNHENNNSKEDNKKYSYLNIVPREKFSLGDNFANRKYESAKDYYDALTHDVKPVFSSENFETLEFIANKLTQSDMLILFSSAFTYQIDESFYHLDYDKYLTLTPGYSASLVIMEKVLNKDNLYADLINEAGSYFVVSKSNPLYNTLSIVTWLASFGIPKAEIIYALQNNVTINEQLALDDMCAPAYRGAFSFLDQDKFDNLTNWEKRLFYKVAQVFHSMDNSDTHYWSKKPEFDLSLLAGFFVNSLYLHKNNLNMNNKDYAKYLSDNLNFNLSNFSNKDVDAQNSESYNSTNELISLITSINTMTQDVIKNKKEIEEYADSLGVYPTSDNAVTAAAKLLAHEKQESGIQLPLSLLINIANN